MVAAVWADRNLGAHLVWLNQCWCKDGRDWLRWQLPWPGCHSCQWQGRRQGWCQGKHGPLWRGRVMGQSGTHRPAAW